MDFDALQANYQPFELGEQSRKKKKGGRGGTLTALISEGGAFGGAATGAAIGSVVPVLGTTIGGLLGGALGAFGGRVAENKVRDDRLGLGDASKEALLTGLLGAPVKTAKYGLTAAKAYKKGRKAENIADVLRVGKVSAQPVANVKDLSGVERIMANKQSRLSNPLDATDIRVNTGAVSRLADGRAPQKRGDTLVDALTAGARAADTPGIIGRALGRTKGKIANKAASVRDDAALKNFKLNDSNWITRFQQKVGEDPGAFAARLGFATSNPKDVAEKFYNPLQDVYTSYLQQVPAITKQDVQQALTKRIAEYAKSDVADVRAMGDKLKSEADTLLSRLPDNFSALDARAKKAAFQSAVDEKLTDSAGKLANNTNKQIADVFRTLVNDKADAAGIVIDPNSLPITGIKATNIRELGNELRGLKEFADKAAVKQNVGRGKNPIGLTSAVGATGGGAMAGIPGAAVGAGITTVANSQTGRRAEFGLAQRLANMSKSPSSPLRRGAGIGARGATGASLVDAMTDYSSPLDPSMSDSTQMNTNTAMTPSNANIDTQYQNTDDLSSSSPYSQENLLADIQRDPENADKYIGYYQSLQEIFAAPESEQLSSEAAKNVSNAQTGLQALSDFQAAIDQDPNVLAKRSLPGRGLLGGALGSALGTRGADAAAQQIVDIIARLRTGAAITNDEAVRFEQFIPQAFDPPEVRQQKINYLGRQFQMVAQRGASSQPGSLEEAMMQGV